MSLKRGAYGIEFDDRPGFPYQRLGWVVVLIPLAALAALFFRGCVESDASALQDGADPFQEAHLDASEARPMRERPAFLRHFRERWTRQARSAGADAAPQARIGRTGLDAPRSPTAAPTLPPEARRLLDLAAAREDAGDWVAARRALSELLGRREADTIRAYLERRLGELNIRILFGNHPAPEKIRHRVAPGETIGRLAQRLGNTQDYLLRVNELARPENLQAGREIWALDQPAFTLTVFRRAGVATLTLNGEFVKRYPIGTGRVEETPTGVYQVRGRIQQPVYRSPDRGDLAFGAPGNFLGSHWIELQPIDAEGAVQVGLHGTWDESSLGRQLSEGWVRFRNADIEELHVLLPLGSRVAIVE